MEHLFLMIIFFKFHRKNLGDKEGEDEGGRSISSFGHLSVLILNETPSADGRIDVGATNDLNLLRLAANAFGEGCVAVALHADGVQLDDVFGQWDQLEDGSKRLFQKKKKKG